jgi:hypothetical protein
MILTRNISFVSAAAFSLLVSLGANANELMSKSQYADYSVRYQCVQLRFHDDLTKQGEEIVKIESDFGLNEDNFEAFDELVQAYEKDDTLLDDIRARVSKECI